MTVPTWFRIAARLRGVITLAGLIGIAAGTLGGLLAPDRMLSGGMWAGLGLAGFVVLLAGIAVSMWPAAPAIAPRPVHPPLRGRWSALNSPASKTPSHGTHGYGQTYAIDLVYEPADGARPQFGDGPEFRPPTDFPAFGQEVLAPADGTVVAVRDLARDHLSRSGWGAFVYLMVEGTVRELGGAGRVIGNHVVLDLGDGAYATFAHLQRGSARVLRGDRVRPGQVIGLVGNSGNSSEPHLHFQLADHPRAQIAAGLPFTFTGPGNRVPANGETIEFTADRAGPSAA